MRVAVNLTWLSPGRVGGSEEYLTRQLAGVDDAEFDVELFVDPAFASAHDALARRLRTHAVPVRGGGRGVRVLAEHSWLAVRTRGFDLVHHGGGTAPLVGGRPTVVTVHDLQYRTFPQYFGAARRRYLDAMTPRAVRAAAVTAVPSGFVRDEVVAAFDVDPEAVVVVPHGVPDLRRPAPERIAAVRERWGLGGRPFVVYPAITHPHKGHLVLIDLLDHLDDDTMLVLPGGSGAAETSLDRAIGRSRHRARVVRTGRVPDADRDALVADADVLAFPSEFEGFGAPVVEAMTLDTPVVCSDAPALVEVVGDAGIVVRRADGPSWAEGVAEARRRRDELVQAGRERRRRFTVAAAGDAIMAVYRRAAS